MKTIKRPISRTIFFGMICGFTFIPASTVLAPISPWSTTFPIIIWSYVLLYGLLLTRWGEGNWISITFPLLILLVGVIAGDSTTSFLLLSIGILGWIRSGICFQKNGIRMLFAEFFTCGGGGALVAYFSPETPVSWAIGVWMFFLVQSLYFVIIGESSGAEEGGMEEASFERACREAEKILSAP